MGWDRFRVLGKPERWSLCCPYQRLLSRKWQQRAAVLPVVRPNCRFSFLFHPLESTTHHVSVWSSSIHTQLYILDFHFLPSLFLIWEIWIYWLNSVFLLCFSFSVDGTPIREFKNMESIGVPFPKSQPMRIYSSLWNADDWATRGGLVKTDWTQAPFTASYRNYNANACVWSNGVSSCSSSTNSNSSSWLSEELDSTSQARLKWVQKKYMIYNYCTDNKRFPQGLPPECKTS